MSRTYKATGINLRAMPMGEHDRLLTVLTQEHGLIRAIAPGARKHKSSLGGRSSLFVVNRLEVVHGRSLDKIIQAQTTMSFPGLSHNLGTLMASQYLAELALCQALSNQSQADLFSLLIEHLTRLEHLVTSASPSQPLPSMVVMHLCHASFHLLALAGVAPQVHACCITQQPLTPVVNQADWWVGFSSAVGGTIAMTVNPLPDLTVRLTAHQLTLLQHLTEPDLPWSEGQENVPQSSMVVQGASASIGSPALLHDWLTIERLLRHHAQYHFERPIRSADLMESYLSIAQCSV